jgi:hypothetical protein
MRQDEFASLCPLGKIAWKLMIIRFIHGCSNFLGLGIPARLIQLSTFHPTISPLRLSLLLLHIWMIALCPESEPALTIIQVVIALLLIIHRLNRLLATVNKLSRAAGHLRHLQPAFLFCLREVFNYIRELSFLADGATVHRCVHAHV